MAHQMIITFSDEEYTALEAAAQRMGRPLETVIHDALAPHFAGEKSTKRQMTSREFLEHQYREGKIANMPTPRPLTQAEKVERERLAQAFAGGKLASEMVIEDRGPKE